MTKVKNFVKTAGVVQKWGGVVIAIANWFGQCMQTFPTDAFNKLVES